MLIRRLVALCPRPTLTVTGLEACGEGVCLGSVVWVEPQVVFKKSGKAELVVAESLETKATSSRERGGNCVKEEGMIQSCASARGHDGVREQGIPDLVYKGII
jgi:hypothetical protein